MREHPGARGRRELTRSDRRYYPVKVDGGLLSMGDTHLAQGDSELDGTGIETSLNGKIKISLLKKADLPPYLEDLSFPLLENENEYVVHGFTFKDYITELGYDTDAPTGNVFLMSNVDQTMANTYEQTRDFIMCGRSDPRLRRP